MKAKEYYIEKIEYFNRYGKSEDVYFVVKYFYTFLFWTWYKYITHKECYESGCHRSRTKFINHADAEYFINNTICKNKPKDRYESNDVDIIYCK